MGPEVRRARTVTLPVLGCSCGSLRPRRGVALHGRRVTALPRGAQEKNYAPMAIASGSGCSTTPAVRSAAMVERITAAAYSGASR